MKKVLVTMLLVSALSVPAWAQAPKQQGIKEVALNWLVLVDNEQYEESYKETASHFQAQLTLGQWIGSLKRVRTTMGKVASRKFLSSTYMTELPNAPKGNTSWCCFNRSWKTAARRSRRLPRCATPISNGACPVITSNRCQINPPVNPNGLTIPPSNL